jgi:zinc protease
VFRVGQADETLPTRGLTHLVEHLAFGPAAVADERQGSVDLLTTALTARGTADEVVRALQALARALADPPTERLDLERSVLAAESEQQDDLVPIAPTLALRFGARGPGLAGFEELGLRGVDAEGMRAHAARWFTRGNAALWATAPLAELDLPLPPGPRRPVADVEPLDLGPLPARVPSGVVDLTLSALAPASPALGALSFVLEARARRLLREERGLAYAVSTRLERVGRVRRELVVQADVSEEDAGLAADLLVDELRALAERGPCEEELAAVRGLLERSLASPEELPSSLHRCAAAELTTGERHLPLQVREELEAVGPDGVAQAAQGLLTTLLALVPAGEPLPALPDLDPPLPAPVQRRVHQRRRFAKHVVAPDATVVGDDGVMVQRGEERVVVPFAQCAAAVRTPGGGLDLVGLRGDVVSVDPGDLRDGEAAVTAIERALPPGLFVPLEPRAARVERALHRPLPAWFSGAAPEVLASELGRREPVRFVADATRGVRGGVVAVTDRRLVFAAQLLADHVRAWPLEALGAVRVRTNPLYPCVELRVGDERVRLTFLTPRRAREAARGDRRRAPRPHHPTCLRKSTSSVAVSAGRSRGRR